MSAAAAYLGMSTDLLLDHVRNGDIAYIMKGSGLKRPRRMFHIDDLDAFLSRRRRVECPSTKGPTASGSMTSSLAVVDFVARRMQRHAARQSAKKDASKPRPSRT
ncbi:helix-turn-helix domain-containing protein [Chelatococcus reniformis]|uniref:helix-turn-helix domain-containing protein n=1 Tax=Chelatococcus reniformis TaxID=1494448 RepID=UPI001669D29F|nr:helix-turn-helix domain-containing protein [Chelatococcus reniformis]